MGEQCLPSWGKETSKHPLVLVKCPSCHLVQLRDTVDQSLLYNDDYGYRSGINETIKADLKDIVSSALRLVPNPRLVTDIGSNDGTLLSYYPAEQKVEGWDPVKKLCFAASKNLSFKPDATTNLIVEPFQYAGHTADIITAVSMFYDIDDPNEFVADLKKALSPDGVLIIQQNYLGSMLKNLAYDNICHEHLEYYSLISLERLLNKHGLEVFRVEENSINGGSFRTYISHKGMREVEPSVAEMRQKEEPLKDPDTYNDFADSVRRHASELSSALFSVSGPIYAYGASTRGSVLMQYCELPRFISAVVERNPDKIGGKYLGIPIISEEEAEKNPPRYKLILPWFHPSIIEREAGDIPVIIPLPGVRVV